MTGMKKRQRQILYVLSIIIVCTFFTFRPSFGVGKLFRSKHEAVGNIDEKANGVAKHSEDSQETRDFYAMISYQGDLWKFKKLKLFQSTTHKLLLNSKLKFPRAIEKIEKFMLEHDRVPEYWKTTLPTIFFPDGKYVPSYDGLWLEFGVKAGGSIIYPAVLHPDKIIHGFDSFEGLPNSKFMAGAHRVARNDPRIVSLQDSLPNIVFHKGWFKDTCIEFLSSTDEKISFIHIDGDLYESASDVLDCILSFESRVKDNCVLVFDNFVWQDEKTSFVKNHEVKAFFEFLFKTDFDARIVGSIRHSAMFTLHHY